jgi:polyferredoxin
MLMDQAVKKPLIRVRFLPLLRWVLWAAWAGVTLLLVVSAGGFLHVDPFFHVDGFPYAFTAYLIFYGILLGVFVVSLVLGKHAFCSYFCFFSPFMMIGTIVKNRLRYPSLHLEAEKELCNQCRRCNLECPRSLDVAGMVQEEELTGPECILCGVCVDSCPKQAVRYGWRWG